MQFDVYRNPDRTVRDVEPFIVELQHDHLSHLTSVVTVPLMECPPSFQGTRLTPLVEFEGRRLVLKMFDPSAYWRQSLKNPVGSIADSRDAIVSAVDVLFTGV